MATQLREVYKCNVCGNMVEMIHMGAGDLVCCGQPMDLEKEKTEDEGNEKHKPIIEYTEDGIKVKVGSIEHPMEEEHFIEWIEIIASGNHARHFLKPGDKPETFFDVKAENVEAKIYCNVHGLWKS